MSCTQCSGTGTWVQYSVRFHGNAKDTKFLSADQCPCCDGTGTRKWRWPFSNGTESMVWKEENCFRCLKGYDDEAMDWRCDLERALDASAAGGGKGRKGDMISVELAETLGIDRWGGERRCREFVEDINV